MVVVLVVVVGSDSLVTRFGLRQVLLINCWTQRAARYRIHSALSRRGEGVPGLPTPQSPCGLLNRGLWWVLIMCPASV